MHACGLSEGAYWRKKKRLKFKIICVLVIIKHNENTCYRHHHYHEEFSQFLLEDSFLTVEWEMMRALP